MSFDIVNTLEIPQGATELTTSQLKQISGGHKKENQQQKGKRKGKGKKKQENRQCKENNDNNCNNN